MSETPWVLVLEDSLDLRRALEKFLVRRGWGVKAVGTLEEAVALLEEGSPDLLLSDIDLPDGSGVDLVRQLTDLGRTIPSILITGLPDMALAADGMRAGALDFLPKPLDLERLDHLLEMVLEERSRRAVDPPGSAGSPQRAGRGEASGEREPGPPRLVGRHPTIVELFKGIGTAAASASPVLIRGESGTGKELVAREVHRYSRPGTPFIPVNCASVPDTLVESELFGHERGAFTGAAAARKGRFELAGEGTIFLDEIGDASPGFQAAILRVLQEGEFLPLGADRPRKSRARVIAATHRSLESMAEEGSFRSDLLYRIQVLELTVSPLRERRSDLPELARYLVGRMARTAGRPAALDLSEEALEELRRYSWPGNVRELENVLERAISRAHGSLILPRNLEMAGLEGAQASGSAEGSDPEGYSPDLPLDDLVHRHVRRALETAEGNKREAARRLGISPGRLYRILESGEDPDEDDPGGGSAAE